jgi:hypothetical protein
MVVIHGVGDGGGGVGCVGDVEWHATSDSPGIS